MYLLRDKYVIPNDVFTPLVCMGGGGAYSEDVQSHTPKPRSLAQKPRRYPPAEIRCADE